MSIGKPQFKRIVEEKIENEKKAASLLYASAEKTNNPVIRLMLCQLALDSAKHEHMLTVILQLLESPSKEQFKCEGEGFREVMKNHVSIERGMLEDFEEIIDKIDDNRIRFILQEIVSDEKKHHAIVKRMYELLCEAKKVKDEKWWDFLFRYSRLAG